MGYAAIEVKGKQLKLLTMGVLKLGSVKDPYKRLQRIHDTVGELIGTHHPVSCAIEAPFFGKNVQSMLKLGRAQGVAIAAAMSKGLDVTEYSPKKIKQSITGNGNSDKEQVWKMLQQILSLQEQNLNFFDASDALAVAVCHHYQEKFPEAITGNKAKGWEDFLLKNPERVKVNVKK
jgi:crossover junction endodeoxyribonuclease RuvC